MFGNLTAGQVEPRPKHQSKAFVHSGLRDYLSAFNATSGFIQMSHLKKLAVGRLIGYGRLSGTVGAVDGELRSGFVY